MKTLLLLLILFALLTVPTMAQLPSLPSGPGGADPSPCDTCGDKTSDEYKQQKEEWEQLAKSIRGIQYGFDAPNNVRSVCNALGVYFAPEVSWSLDSDDANPTKIRVSWRFNKGWPSINDANTSKRGNAMLSPDTRRFIIPLRKWPTNKDLKVRIRQVYKNEKSGPWNKIVIPWPCD